MKIVYSFLIFAGCCTMFFSCSVCDCRKVPCAAFNDPLFDLWFPYSKDQEVLFKNSTGVLDSTYISSIETSIAYEATKGCYGADAACNSQKVIRTSDNYFYLLYHNEQPFTGDPFAFARFQVLGSEFYAGAITDNGLKGDTVYSLTRITNYPTFVLDNRQFENVQVLENDTVVHKNDKVYKVFLSKGKGIIAYETFPDQQRWTVQ